jgi:hypothetical protein
LAYTPESKHISAGFAAIGILALAASGYIHITTPEAAKCAVDLADASARLEVLTEVKDSCRTALEHCQKRCDHE